MDSTNSDSTCTECGGRGWVLVEKDGRDVAQRCHCHQEAALRRLLSAAAIPQRYLEKELHNFDTYLPELKAARTIVSEFVDKYPAVDKGLLLIGPPGTGKTHLATAVLKAAIEKCRIRGLFVDYREFIRSIQNSFDPTTEATQMSIVTPVLEADLVLMDELGALSPTAWIQDTITYILNNRYTNEKITIFTTNLIIDQRVLKKWEESIRESIAADLSELQIEFPPEAYRILSKRMYNIYKSDISQYSPLEQMIGIRLMSRLYEMCDFVPFDGIPDYRKKS